MAHANNAIYLDWLEESVADAAQAGPPGSLPEEPALTALPRRYRMEFALAIDAGAELDGAAWRDGPGWCYRLAGAGDGVDRFRARIDTGPAADPDAVPTTEEPG